MQSKPKLIIFTAPSGAGKTTVVRHLLAKFDNLSFSISATTREKRTGEIHGKDYYFISPDEFRRRIEQDAFVEWEEVYPDQFYGTLHSEIHRIWAEKKTILFDIDVHGALKIKKAYGSSCLTIFVKPPSREVHFQRLRARRTESEESLQNRIAKVEREMGFAGFFDVTLINDNLDETFGRAEEIVRSFTGQTDQGVGNGEHKKK